MKNDAAIQSVRCHVGAIGPAWTSLAFPAVKGWFPHRALQRVSMVNVRVDQDELLIVGYMVSETNQLQSRSQGVESAGVRRNSTLRACPWRHV
ncbi:hypothetical protein MRX96_034333 [Rhipicephalus microplus]